MFRGLFMLGNTSWQRHLDGEKWEASSNAEILNNVCWSTESYLDTGKHYKHRFDCDWIKNSGIKLKSD